MLFLFFCWQKNFNSLVIHVNTDNRFNFFGSIIKIISMKKKCFLVFFSNKKNVFFVFPTTKKKNILSRGLQNSTIVDRWKINVQRSKKITKRLTITFKERLKIDVQRSKKKVKRLTITFNVQPTIKDWCSMLQKKND